MAFLSRKKDKWADSRASSLRGVLVGDAITKNSKADIYYRNAIKKETNKFISSIINDLSKHYTTLKVNNAVADYKKTTGEVMKVLKYAKGSKLRIFQKNSTKIIEKWLKLAKRNADKSIRDSLYKLAGKDIRIEYNKDYDDVLKMMINRNVQLIKNMTEQALTNIENIVYDAITVGEGWKGIKESLEHQPEITAKRIELIARDQTAKTNQSLNAISQQSAGIKYFMWKTAQDERVSTGFGGHKQLNNKIYKWGDTANYPIIDSYGNRGLPSQRVNCRCNARAVWILKGYKAKQLPDGSYEIVRENGLFD